MTQSTAPEQRSDEFTERELAIMAHKAATGDLELEEYFQAVRERAQQAVGREVASYESAHPWWHFLLGIH